MLTSIAARNFESPDPYSEPSARVFNAASLALQAHGACLRLISLVISQQVSA